MTTRSLQGLTDVEFDELARAVAGAYAREDYLGAERLYGELHVRGIVPHMQRTLHWAMRTNVEADDVAGRALLRIIEALRAGKVVQQAMLLVIYRRSAWDIAQRGVLKHENPETRHLLRDDEILDELIGRARGAEDTQEAVQVDFQTMRDGVHAHLIELKRGDWAKMWLEWCAGEDTSAVISRKFGWSVEKGRRIKSELSSYLCGVGRHFFDHLDRVGADQ